MRFASLLSLGLLVLACGGGGSVDGPRPSGTAGTSLSGGAGVGGSSALGGSAQIAGAGMVMAGASSGGMPIPGGAAGSGGNGGMVARPDDPVPASERVVVYLPAWRGSASTWKTRIDFTRLNYLNLCFAEVDETGNVTYSDAALDELVASAHAAGVRACMAIGGGSVIEDGGPFKTVLQDANRAAFVDELAAFAQQHQLDCIDVNLEGNGVNQYYEAFVTALAPKLHAQGQEITAAVSSWFGNKITDAAMQAFDFINVMAYDLHNPAGAAQPVQPSSIAEATAEVEYWVKRGLAKDKAVFGVPFYGYRWAGAKGEALTYADILAAAPMAATQDQVQVDGGTTYLNSRTTIQAKAVLAKQYGGIMVWELGQDAAGEASLLKAIADVP